MTIGNIGGPVIFTPDGGLAYWVENQTGEVSVKGKLIEPSTTTDMAVQLIGLDDPDPIGVIFSSGIAVGKPILIVFSGLAEVLFGNTPTRAYFARNAQTGDGIAAGLAIAEPLPSPPFATDKHFLEIGHIMETKGAPGLAFVNLHFN